MPISRLFVDGIHDFDVDLPIFSLIGTALDLQLKDVKCREA